MKASLIPCGFETICLLQSHQAQMLQPRVVRLVLSLSPSKQPGFCRVNGLTASLDWQQDEQTELVHRALRSSHQQCVSMARRENSQRIHGHRGYTLHSRQHPNNPHHIIPPACPQHSVEGIQMSAERARSGRLEHLWLPKTPGRNL